MTPPPEPWTAAGRAHLKDGSATANTDARRKAIVAIEAEKDAEYERVVDLYRQQREEARDEAEAADAPLREALERIDRDGCHNFYGGQRCWEAGRLRDALYGAEKWCDACVARAALTATPAPAPLDAVSVVTLDKAIRVHLEEWGEHQCGYDPCGRNIAKQAARLTAPLDRPTASIDVEAGLAVLDNLKERAHEYWSEESLKNNYAFHPNVFWAWLDEERARLTARAAATEDTDARCDHVSAEHGQCTVVGRHQRTAGPIHVYEARPLVIGEGP